MKMQLKQIVVLSRVALVVTVTGDKAGIRGKLQSLEIVGDGNERGKGFNEKECI